MILNNIKHPKDSLFESFKKWLKVKSLELRYGLISGSMHSNGLACYIASARPRRNPTQDKIESGMVGKNDLSARLTALELWVRKHAQPKEFILGNDKSAFAFVNIDKSDNRHTFLIGQTQYGMGQEPVGGHKPVTIIEVENGVIPCDTRCDKSKNLVACDSCKPNH